MGRLGDLYDALFRGTARERELRHQFARQMQAIGHKIDSERSAPLISPERKEAWDLYKRYLQPSIGPLSPEATQTFVTRLQDAIAEARRAG